MIDDGETDWKLMGIDITDPLASKVNDVEDIDKIFPGLVVATNEWFRIYKIPAGKPENEFAFKGECMNKEFALGVIQETNEQWKTMITGPGYKDLSCMNTGAIDGAREKVTAEDAAKELAECPAKTDDAPLDPSGAHLRHPARQPARRPARQPRTPRRASPYGLGEALVRSIWLGVGVLPRRGGSCGLC